MGQQHPLEIGHIYFALAYEGDGMRYPVVHSYEYLGTSDEATEVHLFRFLGSGDSLELTEGQLDLIVRWDELTKMLQKWATDNPALSG